MTDVASAWAQAEAETAENVDIEELDTVVREYFDARTAYEEASAESKRLNKEKDAAQARLLDYLKRTKKSKYSVDGIGTVLIANKYSIRVPKTIEEKKKLFHYIREQYGMDVLYSKLGIHSGALNAFYNEEAEAYAARGEDFELPGVGAPTAMESVKLIKERKKSAK